MSHRGFLALTSPAWNMSPSTESGNSKINREAE
jgi:hypothetical protein